MSADRPVRADYSLEVATAVAALNRSEQTVLCVHLDGRDADKIAEDIVEQVAAAIGPLKSHVWWTSQHVGNSDRARHEGWRHMEIRFKVRRGL